MATARSTSVFFFDPRAALAQPLRKPQTLLRHGVENKIHERSTEPGKNYGNKKC
jgi:hypothetical protein